MKRKNENKVKRKMLFLGVFLMSILGSVVATIVYYRDNTNLILKNELFKFGTVIFILAVILAKAILGIDVLLAAEKIISKYIAVNGRLLSGVLYWAIGAVVYYLYDYAMTLIITFYMERIHNKIK